ncbi:MAG TPA: hypothetical protein VHO70_07505 [Chitinispirillaceae bacterium]|nr:hypothetical protein [Chitinispirillaceae bacterium]
MALNIFSGIKTVDPKIQTVPEPLSGCNSGYGVPQFYHELLQYCITQMKPEIRKSFREAASEFLQCKKAEWSSYSKYLPENFLFDPAEKSTTDPLKYLSELNYSGSTRQDSLVSHLLKPFEKVAHGRIDPVKSDTWGIKEILDRFHLFYDVDLAPEDFLPWLATWMAFEWVEDPGWEEEVSRRWLPVDLFYEIIKADDFLGNHLHSLFAPYFRDSQAASEIAVQIPDEAFSGIARWTARQVAIEWGEQWNIDFKKWDEEIADRFRSLCVKTANNIYKRLNEFFSQPAERREDILLWLSRAVFAPCDKFIDRMNDHDINQRIFDLFNSICCKDEQTDFGAASPAIVKSIKYYTAIELTGRWTKYFPWPGETWENSDYNEFLELCYNILDDLKDKCRLWYYSPGRRTGMLSWWLRLFTFTIDPLYLGRKNTPVIDLIDTYYHAFQQLFTFDPVSQLRRLLTNHLPHYGNRGTRDGFEELLTVYLGEDWAGLIINELLNPFQIGCDFRGKKLASNHSDGETDETFNFSEPEFQRIIRGRIPGLRDFIAMGNRGMLRSVVGCSTVINEGKPYFFKVFIDTARPHKPVLIRRKKNFFQDVIALEKPAHTVNTLTVSAPSMCIGRHSTIDKDTLIGGITI